MSGPLRYVGVVIKTSQSDYGVRFPDLPGCVAVAKSLPAVKRLIREGIALHVEDMRERGEKPPRPRATVDYIDAKVA